MIFQSDIVKIETVLTIEGKVLVFKSLAISKIVHLSLITTVPHAIINQLNNIQKKLYMERKKSKNKTFKPHWWFEIRWRIYKSY